MSGEAPPYASFVQPSHLDYTDLETAHACECGYYHGAPNLDPPPPDAEWDAHQQRTAEEWFREQAAWEAERGSQMEEAR